MVNPSRRKFLKTGLLGGLGGVFTANTYGEKLSKTPSEIEGPFYPIVAQKDKDFDLTVIKGKSQHAKGKAIIVEGFVFDTNRNLVTDASVDIWQANSAGRYNHPHDPNTYVPMDPNFQGWAIVLSGEKGKFRFKTIFPGTYKAGEDWTRPPHIHFKVSKLGYEELYWFSGNDTKCDF